MNGEINLDEEFGKTIYHTVIEYNLKRNLEIGSWDGEGSTHCFASAMNQLSTVDKELICIEIVKDKADKLIDLYKNYKWVKCLNKSSICYDEMLIKSFDVIWHSPYNKIPGRYSKDMVQQWYDRDIASIKQSSDYADISKIGEFDSVLIDGSEFTGYSEYMLIKDKCKVLFLDDVHHAYKCNQIYNELLNNNDWVLLKENPSTRNGYAVFLNRNK